MKLTPDVIEAAFQFINKATRDRELDLRAYKIGAIENLGATLDQFDCLDFTDNDIRRLENFPLLLRTKRLYMSNNRIVKIDDTLAESLPNLEGLLLINNQLQELGDLDPLTKCSKLEMISLYGNPVANKKHYRLYLIHKLPSLRLLDFKKVKLREREEAEKLFGGEAGAKLAREVGVKSKTFTPGEDLNQQQAAAAAAKRQLSSAEVAAIKDAIKKASTLEEVERLQEMLKLGCIPGNAQAAAAMPVQNMDTY